MHWACSIHHLPWVWTLLDYMGRKARKNKQLCYYMNQNKQPNHPLFGHPKMSQVCKYAKRSPKLSSVFWHGKKGRGNYICSMVSHKVQCLILLDTLFFHNISSLCILHMCQWHSTYSFVSSFGDSHIRLDLSVAVRHLVMDSRSFIY